MFYVEQVEADTSVDCGGLLIAPGFIDIQINGMYYILKISKTAEGSYRKHGLSSIFPNYSIVNN